MRRGFTLLEMMAVVLLTGIVLTAVVNFTIDLSRANRAALERVRGERRSVAILDRVARDLEGSVLLKKPDEVDPLAHPWLFLADTPGELGAERIKFVSRSRTPRISALRESDLEMVAYWLDELEDGSLALLRWSAPHLPEGLVREFPPADDPGVAVLAHGVLAFGVRLVGESGEPSDGWDSSQIVETSQLPAAAEISLALAPETDDGEPVEPDPLAAEPPPAEVATRRVLLPMRPLDLAAQLGDEDGGSGEDEDDEDDEEGEDTDGDGIADEDAEGDDDSECMTVGECVALNRGVFDGLDAQSQATIQSMSGLCFRDVAGSVPFPVVGCQ